MHTSEDFGQLRLRFIDSIQHDYELIRPIVLFTQPISDRSREVEMARSTVGEKARRFVTKGMLGLTDQRKNRPKRKGHQYPEPVASYILFLKKLYPPIGYREITRIIERKFGYHTNHHTVKKYLDRNPIPIQMELKIEAFHEFEDAYQARWMVVRMYYEGWRKQSIADVLKLSRQHVIRLVEAFERDGFVGLEDKRTRAANHAHNQMTLPFLEKVFDLQTEFPRAGRFRVHGILESRSEEKNTPSERTVGRAMAYNRTLKGAPAPWPPPPTPRDRENPKSLPYDPKYRHQYWFIDIRYLIKFNDHWVYSICIIEGYSRKILAGLVSEHQDELAILQLLHAAFCEYGRPENIVSDNGAVFKANAYKQLLEKLEIEPCYIVKRQAWQNLIETQFKIQLRLVDAKFEQASNLTEIQEHHAAFIQVFNTTNHWAHRQREDGLKTPVAVLGWEQGRPVTPEILRSVFRHLQYSRKINQKGLVSVQRFYIYAHRGLASKRVAIWIYEDRLQIEHQQTPLARYTVSLDRQSNSLTSITNPQIYQTPFQLPQLELFELGEAEWKRVWLRPSYYSCLPQGPIAQQLALFNCWGFILWVLTT
ncbi:MAG: DDE-type integrase/transposase/recombinase [Chloroflexota bacterium]